MANNKNTNYTNENYLYVAFCPEDGEPMESKKIHLDRIIYAHFNSSVAKCVYMNNEHKEIIYRIHKPELIHHKEELKKFFNSLEEVFQLTDNLSPHFTQFIENGDLHDA